MHHFITAYFDEIGWPSSIPEAERKQFIQDLHNYKTDQFRSIVESGVVPPRPGGKIESHISTVIYTLYLFFSLPCLY